MLRQESPVVATLGQLGRFLQLFSCVDFVEEVGMSRSMIMKTLSSCRGRTLNLKFAQ